MLALAIVALLLPRQGDGWSLAPLLFAVVAVASGAEHPATAEAAGRALAAPLAFVVFAVPLAVLLDDYGFFAELAEILSGGRHYLAWLWVLAAAVTAGLNLDAAVVLLTPLYVRIAAGKGVHPFALALQPALLSGLASSGLPISNLTNLIAAARLGLGSGAFVVHLALPTAVASAVGFFAYRARFSRLAPAGEVSSPVPGGFAGGDRRPAARTLAIGGALVALIVAGFLTVPLAGGQPWEVAAGADLVLVGLTRRLPWRALPWQSVVAVLGLGVLASAAAHHLPLGGLVRGDSPLALARTTAVAGAGANVVNNLPAVLVALPRLGHGPSWAVWAVLLGTNCAALLVPSGTLAVLLWLATLRRLGVTVHERQWLSATWPIVLPSLVAALAALVALRVLLGSAG